MTDDNGKPVYGPVELNINFYNIPVGGTASPVGPLDFQNVTLQEGIFLVDISLSEADFETLFPDAATPVYIEVTDVTHSKTYSRQRFSMLPYALRVPLDLKTLRFDSQGHLTLAPTSSPSAGQFLTEDTNGNLIWASPSGAATSIDGQSVSSAAPTTGQVLTFDGTKWTPTTVSGSSGGTVTSVSVTGPLNVTNPTSTPQLSITQASSVSAGYLSSADWLTFNAKEPAVTAGTSSQFYRGDKTWQTLNAAAVAGLGTAATLNVGTGANNIVQLDGSGKLPALDGSALTGISAASVAASAVTGLTTGSVAFVGASGLTEDNNNLFWNDTLFRLGIGTKTPSSDLSFGGASAKVVGVERNTGTAAGSGLSLVAGGASSGGTDLNGGDLVLASGVATGAGTSKIQFQTAGGGSTGTSDSSPTTKMTILGNGNVGVGTSSPAVALDVYGASAPGGYARFSNNATYSDASGTQVLITNNGSSNSYYALRVATGNGGINGMAVTDAGNVGIGTTSPNSKLEVNGAIRIDGSTSGYVGFSAQAAAGSTTYVWPAAPSAGYYLQTDASGNLAWAAGNAGTVTSVTGSGPISVTNTTTTPAISLGTVGVANGGTGLTTITSNGILYGNGTSNVGVTAAGSQYQVLQAGSGGIPAFGALNLAQSAAVTGALPVANGGTGATTASAALTALGAAASGANSDITSLTGISTPLAISEGGTGSANAMANVVFAGPTSGLATAPSFRALVAADLPAMGGANGTTGGTAGIVPAPAATDNVKFLRGDGTWAGALSSAGGSTGQVQFNNSGALAGSANLFWDNTNGRLGIGSTTPQTALDVGTGIITGGTYSGNFRNTLDLSGTSGIAAVDEKFPAGGIFRAAESSVAGTNDVFFQAMPATTAGYGYLEAWNGAGMILGTGNATPVLIRPNRQEAMRVTWDDKVGIGITNPAGRLDVSGSITGTPSLTGAYFGQSVATFTDNATAASGTATNMAFNSFMQPTLAATNTSVTTTSAYTNYIAGAPVHGTNDTATNAIALGIGAGAVGAQTNSYGLYVNAQTGATNNYAATFLGGNVGIGTASPTNALTVIAPTTADYNTSVLIGTSATSKAGLVIQGLPSQTGNLQQWEDSTANIVASISPNGSLTLGANSSAPTLTFSIGGNSISRDGGSGAVSFKSQNYGGAGWVFDNSSGSAGTTPLGVKGVAGQTADLFEVYNNAMSMLLNVTAAGKVGIGMSSPSYALDVTGDVHASGCFEYGATPTVLGGVCASDERLKKNIVPITGALERVMALRPVTYEYRSDEHPEMHLGQGEQEGLIAQELEKVMPHLVVTGADGFKRVKYGLELQMQTMAAVKELSLKTDSNLAKHESEIEALRQENASLKRRFTSLEEQNDQVKSQLNELKALVCAAMPGAAACHP